LRRAADSVAAYANVARLDVRGQLQPVRQHPAQHRPDLGVRRLAGGLGDDVVTLGPDLQRRAERVYPPANQP
jgi:hypothetical protein